MVLAGAPSAPLSPRWYNAVNGMRFHLTDELLLALRTRRREQQTQRTLVPTRGLSPLANFMDHVRELFSTAKADPKRAADNYVEAMSQWQDEVEGKHDTFLLDPGMGPMLYLTADGRVLTDGRGWDGEPLREASDDEAIGAILVGAEKTGIVALLALLPRKPPNAEDCPTCAGARFAKLPTKSADGSEMSFVCWACRGRGW